MDGLKGPKIDISLHGKKEERHSLIRVSRKLPRNCDTAKDTSESTVFNDQSLWCYLSTRFWLWSKLIGWRLRGKKALWPVVFLLVCICSRGWPIDRPIFAIFSLIGIGRLCCKLGRLIYRRVCKQHVTLPRAASRLSFHWHNEQPCDVLLCLLTFWRENYLVTPKERVRISFGKSKKNFF